LRNKKVPGVVEEQVEIVEGAGAKKKK